MSTKTKRKRGAESGKRIANEQTGHGHSANRTDYSVEVGETSQNQACAEVVTGKKVSAQ